MSGSQRADAEDVDVVLDSLTGCLGGSLEQRAHVDVETAVGITGCYDLGAAVVAVLTHLGDHDTRLTTFALGKFLTHLTRFLKVGVVLCFV